PTSHPAPLPAIRYATPFRSRPANGTVLAGGGTITLGGTGNNVIQGANSGTDILTNLDNTIQGVGNIGANAMGLVNFGTINANQPAGLTIDPNDSVGFLNIGTLQVSSGSGLN